MTIKKFIDRPLLSIVINVMVAAEYVLTACQLSSERLALRQQEVAAAERAYEVSKDVMQNSSSTYLEVLTAQQSLLQSRLSLVSDRFDLVQGKINLFKALGGENIHKR